MLQIARTPAVTQPSTTKREQEADQTQRQREHRWSSRNLSPAAARILNEPGALHRSVSTKVANIVKRHDEWIGIFDSAGRFAVSVYALTLFSLTDVLERMPHGQNR